MLEEVANVVVEEKIGDPEATELVESAPRADDDAERSENIPVVDERETLLNPEVDAACPDDDTVSRLVLIAWVPTGIVVNKIVDTVIDPEALADTDESADPETVADSEVPGKVAAIELGSEDENTLPEDEGNPVPAPGDVEVLAN